MTPPLTTPAATGPAPQISLVLACYNEAEHFTTSLRDIFGVLDACRWTWEIIFVDDGSRDETRALIDALIAAEPGRPLRRIFHERNTGRGGAVSDGFRAARAPIVGYIDIDLEVHARYLPSAIQAIEQGADVVIAHRVYTFHVRSTDRYLMSHGYQVISRLVLGIPALDTESGYKFFRRDRLLPLLDEIQDQGWFWDTEVIVRALSRGYRVTEFPALFTRRFDKTSTVRGLSDSLAYLGRLWRFRRQMDRGGL